jgi:hypothetical protein
MKTLKASKIFRVPSKTLQTLANKNSRLPKKAAAIKLGPKAVGRGG